MSKSVLSSLSVAALAGGAMLALELSPASAFTLSGPSVQLVTSGQFDKVYYRGYHGGYRGYPATTAVITAVTHIAVATVITAVTHIAVVTVTTAAMATVPMDTAARRRSAQRPSAQRR